MKFRLLQSIAHNVADSLASGTGFLIGVYMTDIFGEASRSQEGYVLVDFLTGTSSGAKVTKSLAGSIRLYKEGLTDLCKKHDASPADFRQLTARYSGNNWQRVTTVTVEDIVGRKESKDYVGTPARRIRELDRLGRVRPG